MTSKFSGTTLFDVRFDSFAGQLLLGWRRHALLSSGESIIVLFSHHKCAMSFLLCISCLMLSHDVRFINIKYIDWLSYFCVMFTRETINIDVNKIMKKFQKRDDRFEYPTLKLFSLIYDRMTLSFRKGSNSNAGKSWQFILWICYLWLSFSQLQKSFRISLSLSYVRTYSVENLIFCLQSI